MLPTNPPTRRIKTGHYNHKPGCICRPCAAARSGKTKAVIVPERARGESLVAIPKSKEAPLEADIIPYRSIRDRVAEWVLYRAQGMRHADIAAKLGIQSNTLSTMVSRATREGWLKFDGPADRLEYELVPMAVDNLREFLIDQDKQVTLEVLKGTGIFKSHQAVKVENDAPPMVLALKFDTAEAPIQVIGGTILGKPKLPIIDIEKS